MNNSTKQTKQKIRVLFCDQLNLARGKYLPESVASSGEAGICKGVFAVTYSRLQLNVPGGGVDEGLPDVTLKFDPDSYRDSWHSNTKIAIADVYEDGKPYGLCGRSALKKAIEGWRRHGLDPMIGLEGEAYVLESINDGLKPYSTPGSYVYGTGLFNDPEKLMDVIWSTAEKCDIPVESINAEYDAPQFELTLRYADALKACDDFFLFKNMAREVLYEKGYVLSYLPKPFEGISGSGLHINLSFKDTEGNNALANGISENNLSDLAKGCVAGLLKHHEALGGVLAPTINSYDRLTKEGMCGYWATWGHDHRGAAVRLSKETGNGARIEHRIGDCSASPYFAVAAVLQAALLGFEKQYPLPAEAPKNLEQQDTNLSHIASSLSESLKALEADKELSEAIGSELIANYCAIKTGEVNELAGKSKKEIIDYYSYYI